MRIFHRLPISIFILSIVWALSCSIIFSSLLGLMGVTSHATAQGVTIFSLGVPAQGTLSNTNDAHYYQVQVGAGEHLFVVLDSVGDNAYNELYIRYGQLPSRDQYDSKYTLSNKPDQAVEITNTQTGYYYVLV